MSGCTERIERRDRRLPHGGIGVSQQREQGTKGRRIADAGQRRRGRDGNRSIGCQQTRDRCRRATIAELAERRDSGQLDLLVLRTQSIDELVNHSGAVTHERLDDIGAAGRVAQELGQRSRDGRRLDPAKEKHDRPEL